MCAAAFAFAGFKPFRLFTGTFHEIATAVVFAPRDGFEMVWIATTSNAAKMVEVHPFRRGAFCNLKRFAMRQNADARSGMIVTLRYATVASRVEFALP
jgi:hypothetical protein